MLKKDLIKIAIVDDHQIVLDGYEALLKNSSNIKIVFSTTSARELISKIDSIEIDILITDFMMPEINGLEVAKIVKSMASEIKIIILSMSGKGTIVREMIEEADINGYVLKNISKAELLEAIEKVANGGIYFSDEILDEIQKNNEIEKDNLETHLTTREVEIIKLIEKELNNKQIADTLFISERTVETHRKNILRKTNTKSVLGLIKYAYSHNIIAS